MYKPTKFIARDIITQTILNFANKNSLLVVCVIHMSISLCYNSWFVFFNDCICFILDRKHLSTSYTLLEFYNLSIKYSELIPPTRLLPAGLQMVTICWKTFLGDFFFVCNFIVKIINDEFRKGISAPNKKHLLALFCRYQWFLILSTELNCWWLNSSNGIFSNSFSIL